MQGRTLLLAACLLLMPLASVSCAANASSSSDGAPMEAPTEVRASQPSQPPQPPEDVKDAAGQVGEAIEAAKTGQWWYLSSILCLLLMFALKMIGVLKRVGRWKFVILPVLSLAAGLLAAFQGGASLEIAMGVFTSSWATGMLEELWNHGILGKPRESAQKALTEAAPKTAAGTTES